MIKVIPLVASVVSINALSELFFNNNIKDFIVNTTGDGGSKITFRELFNLGGITDYGTKVSGSKLSDLVSANISDGWWMAALTLMGAKALPKIITKIGITRQVNTLSKSAGLGSIVQL
jgi:hypothetical protein